MSKTWFITGASRGIGAGIAHAALEAGDNVAATGRDAKAVAQTFSAYGDRVLPLALDVTEESQSKHAVEATLARFGRVDVLVNNAGYGQLGFFEENTPADIDRQFATNVFGLMHVTRAVLPTMRAQKAGRIFNVSSVGGFIGFATASIYCASKYAVEGFSESLEQEVGPLGIHVTIVEPGYFRTDFLDGSSVRYGDRKLDDAEYQAMADRARGSYEAHNHQQAGDPEKLGKAIVRLASAEKPPIRWAAGTDALEIVSEKIDALRKEVAQWRELTASTDR